ncbi:CNNM transmembrane domain-containing protein [Mycena kentingensis (nom. inval.)]|nr:CNNM transmembrane domain-containing protein [Mycena kentingensis (nom. inval.)]
MSPASSVSQLATPLPTRRLAPLSSASSLTPTAARISHLQVRSQPANKPTIALTRAAVLIPVLVLSSGLFAGLTLGYMSLDETQLNVLSISGTPKQREYANKIKPIRKNGHLLLVTLLLANMITNETLPIVADPILGGGVQSVVVSTVLIVIFAEIIPQSICTRHGLYLGAKMAGFTKFLIYLLGIFAWPVAKILELALGPHHGIIYRRAELKELIAMHSSLATHGGDLKTDTVTIIGATLDLQEKVVRQAMTPIAGRICLTGHSRVPVYEEIELNGSRVKKILGILLVKQCVLLDPKDAIPLRKIPLNKVPFIPNNEPLLGLLDKFQEGRSHMAIVSRFSMEKARRVFALLGLLTCTYRRRASSMQSSAGSRSVSASRVGMGDSDAEEKEKRLRRPQLPSPPSPRAAKSLAQTTPGIALLAFYQCLTLTAARISHLQVRSQPTNKPTVALTRAAVLIPVLVLSSGLFAGLTLGYMSLDETQLNVLSISGTPKQREYANKIKPIRKNGHLLLVTLLLANMITNETLPIVADPILGGGVQSVVVSTVLIVIFAEIIPQSICTRHGLYLGAKMAGFTKFLIYLLGIFAWPVAKILELALGPHHGIIYRRAELKELIAMHSSLATHGGDLKTDTVTIIGATLDLQEKVVRQAMTPIADVFMLSIDANLDYDLLKQICLTGHSRVPVYEEIELNGSRVKKILGILLVKQCVLLDPKDAIPLRKIPLNKVPFIPNNEPLLGLLDKFQEGRSHMAIVSRFSMEKARRVFALLGLLTCTYRRRRQACSQARVRAASLQAASIALLAFYQCLTLTAADIAFAVLIPVLVLSSGLFAGLTLGYMSLDETQLNETTPNTPNKIKPIRKNGHLLLVTLLLANMITNETLPIVADPILGGGVNPWSSRPFSSSCQSKRRIRRDHPPVRLHQARAVPGAKMAGFTKFLIYLLGIFAWPVAKILELALGPHHGIIYRRAELKELIAMHSSLATHGGDLKTDTVTIIGATLDLQEKVVRQAMTPIADVFMLSIDANLDYDLLKQICLTGHSRVPVYEEIELNGSRVKKILGILLVKQCVLLDPKDAIPLRKIPLNKVPFIPNNEPLLGLLDKFQEGRSHMAIAAASSMQSRRVRQRLLASVGMGDSDSSDEEEKEKEKTEKRRLGMGMKKKMRRVVSSLARNSLLFPRAENAWGIY